MEAPPITLLLEQARLGEPEAFDSLISAAYRELRKMAAGIMRNPGKQTLQPTALVNEAYLRMAAGETRWESRSHFFGAAASAMRQVVTGYARERCAKKRGSGAERITFDDLRFHTPEPQADVLALDQALNALAQVDPRFTRVMELRYFAGCTLEEIAELTARSLATVKRDWTYARAWLRDYLNA